MMSDRKTAVARKSTDAVDAIVIRKREEEKKEEKAPKPKNIYVTKSFLSLLDETSDVYKFVNEHKLLKDAVKVRTKGYHAFIYERTDNQSNIFELESKELASKITFLTNYAIYDIKDDQFIQRKSDKNLFNVTCLKDFMLLAIEKLGLDVKEFNGENLNSKSKETKEMACVNLVSFIISLRIIIEMKKASVQFNIPSEKVAMNDWSKLKSYVPKMNQLMTNLDMRDSDIGKQAVNLFTYSQRAATPIVRLNGSQLRMKKSPHEILHGDIPHVLLTKIRAAVRKRYLKKLSQLSSKEKNIGFTANQVLKEITTDNLVGQFSPVTVHDIITALKNQYLFKFPTTQDGKSCGAMLDPCAGWGGRLVGALSYPDIAIYTGVDPNPALASRYSAMAEKYDAGKEVTIFNKKIEDVTKDELQLAEKKQVYQLILTSPPYGVEKYYEDMTDYLKDENLKQLFRGLVSTADVLDFGGFLVINFGVLGPVNKPKADLPELFYQHLKNHPTVTTSQLKLFDKVHLCSKARSHDRDDKGKEYIVYAQRIANMGPIPAPFPAYMELTRSFMPPQHSGLPQGFGLQHPGLQSYAYSLPPKMPRMLDAYELQAADVLSGLFDDSYKFVSEEIIQEGAVEQEGIAGESVAYFPESGHVLEGGAKRAISDVDAVEVTDRGFKKQRSETSPEEKPRTSFAESSLTSVSIFARRPPLPDALVNTQAAFGKVRGSV